MAVCWRIKIVGLHTPAYRLSVSTGVVWNWLVITQISRFWLWTQNANKNGWSNTTVEANISSKHRQCWISVDFYFLAVAVYWNYQKHCNQRTLCRVVYFVWGDGGNQSILAGGEILWRDHAWFVFPTVGTKKGQLWLEEVGKIIGEFSKVDWSRIRCINEVIICIH